MSCAVVTYCRHTHAVTCKHGPDRAAICSAIQVLIGLNDAVACVQERWTSGCELHPVEHNTVCDCSAKLRSQIPKSRGPDFAISVNFEASGADVCVRIV